MKKTIPFSQVPHGALFQIEDRTFRRIDDQFNGVGRAEWVVFPGRPELIGKHTSVNHNRRVMLAAKMI